MLWLILFLDCIKLLHSQTYGYQCLGEYQSCDTGDCVLADKYCGTCQPQQYLCPDTVTCIDTVEDYVNCPNIKGTHLDWTLPIEKRLDYLVKVATLEEKYHQLTHDAPEIDRLAIPAYNWLNDNQHGVRNAHATVFPNGCGIGATWDKDITFDVAQKIAIESRSIHNDLVAIGIRGTGINWGGGGSSITIYAPFVNLVRDPRWGRAQEVFSEDPYLTSKLTMAFVNGLQHSPKQMNDLTQKILNFKDENGNSDENYLNNNILKNENNSFLLTAACCKHFAAYNLESRPEERYYFNAEVNARNWAENYLPQFYTCIVEAKGAHVMCSYNKLNSIPSCANKDLLTTVLREQLQFDGFVVSDYDAMAQIYETHKYARSYEQAVSFALKAGCDQEGGGTIAIERIPEAIKHGLLSMEDVNLAFRRLFRIRIKLGLFDPPHHVHYNYLTHNKTYNENESLQLARKTAQLSICLYKNHNHNVLPLNKHNIRKLIVFGQQAIDTALLLGNYATYPDEGTVTIVRGLRNALGEYQKPICTVRKDVDYSQPGQDGIYAFNVNECCQLCMEEDKCRYYSYFNNHCFLKESSQGRNFLGDRTSGTVLNKYDGYPSKIIFRRGCYNARCLKNEGFSSVNTLFQEHSNEMDAVIVVLGLDQSIENEGNDRSKIELPGNQNNLVALIRKNINQENKNRNSLNKLNLICILIHGGALALGMANNECDAIIDAWYPGSQGGHAIADVIFGDYNPAGRTPVTFYKSTLDLPPEGEMDWYAGKGISYRYFNDEPLYPFGFGLSYTNFSYSNFIVNLNCVSKDNPNHHIYILENLCDDISISVIVTNIGNKDGDEVVQLYLNQPDATVLTPKLRLVDFDRIHIKVGESKEVKLNIQPRYRTVVYDSLKWFEPDIQIEKGRLNLFIGGGQPKYFAGHLTATINVEQSGSFSQCLKN